jgi:peptidoglycan hydrolase-like protein with peptidoglycan-binding domain
MNWFCRRVIAVAGGTLLITGITLAGTLPGAAARTPAAAGPAARAASPAYVPAKRALQYGMRGTDVAALQRRLEQLSYYPGAAGGRFGLYTLEAVWAFQEAQGLPSADVVGPRVAHALMYPRDPRSRYPWGGAQRVEINLGQRVLLLYQRGRLALVSHVSAGGGYRYCDRGSCGYAVTPTGHFRTTTYMPGWVTVPLGRMYNPVFFIGTVYAIHGSTSVPLQPVSHGCVRIPMDVAAFFHTMVRTPGTPVYIYW